MKLYSYYRSSAAYRCRIALNLKGLAHETAFVHLIKDGGQHTQPAYRALNPQAMVPTLQHDGRVITQSLAIIEYLEEIYPEPPLLPGDAAARAKIRAFALAIACDIHPVNNLRILNYLKGPLQQDQAAADAWYRHWIKEGLEACEKLLPPAAGRFAFGDRPTLADTCLIPQLYNARRFNCDLSSVPRLVAIDAACLALPAFADAAPEAQPDAA
ncbi:MAG: maleylacetoacetate isomerase [Hyphomonadaceae bacterium]|nr:maleylacetoacetate isomerase [Hyphomonadaceae bacterium]